MRFAKIIGNTIATSKTGKINGLKLLVARHLNEKLEEMNKTEVCVDTIDADVGDIILLCSSSSARKTKKTKGVCTDNIAVALVDSISTNSKDWYIK